METDEDILVEAAWYCLKPFIHSLDCNQKIELDGAAAYPCAMNSNVAENLYNGTKVKGGFLAPRSFSKKSLRLHVLGEETFYYRSSWNGRPRIGYGSHANACKGMGVAALVLGICEEAKRYSHMGVMLLCADIDSHNGEQDVGHVRDWLLEQWFPGCYWEPSTGGKGVHLYIKLAYPIGSSISATLAHVTKTVKVLGKLIEEQRQVLGFNAPVDHLRGLPSLVYRDQDKRIRLKRSSCIKIPRFSNGICDVLQFHHAPFYLLPQLEKKLAISTATNEEVADCDGVYADPEATDGKKRSGVVMHNSVSPSYQESLDYRRPQHDAFERTQGFCMACSRHRGQVPSADEALDEYEKQGLATGDDVGGRRRKRIEQCLAYTEKTFKPGSIKTLYEGFSDHRDAIVQELKAKMSGMALLKYKKTKDRYCSVPVEDAAAVLFAMRRSQGKAEATEFSGTMLGQALRITVGKKGNTDTTKTIFSALTDAGLIAQVGNHLNGSHGRVWRVR